MLLVLALCAMLGMALAVPPAVRRLGARTGYLLAVGFLVVGLGLATAAPTVLAGSAVTTTWEWLPALGVSFALRLDGLAALFCLIVLGVGALIMAYCPRYLPVDGPQGSVYGLLTLFATAMLGLVLAADVVLLYVFWELTTICSFFLIKTAGSRAGPPATRALLVTAAGGLALLAAVVLLVVATGTTDLAVILADPDAVLSSPLAGPIGALVLLAAFTKSAQLPFQFWLPGAMVAMTPISAYLHAATMVKAGIYLLMRFTPLFAGQPAWAIALIGVGLATALGGALMALREHDLKAILAHSTVSQLGLLIAVIGVGTPTALAAAMLHTLAHALFKATLFMLVGIIDHETGSRDIRELTGLRRRMPRTAACAALAALSMAGVPPLLGFVSKEYLFLGLLEAGGGSWTGVAAGAAAVAASALTFAYGARLVHGAFGGGPARQPDLYEPPMAFLVPAAVPALLGLVLGPAVGVLDPVLNSANAAVTPGAEPLSLSLWHGLSAEVLMSVVTIALGVALFRARDRVDRALQRLRLPDGAAVFDRVQAAVLRAGAAVGRPDRDGSITAVLARPLVALVVLGGVGLVALGTLPEPVAGTAVGDWPVLALLAAGTLAAVVARTALAAVALLGVVGLVVAVWFVRAGAPDVALTLLLVEVLTTVVAVLVLRRTPRGWKRPPRRHVVPTAILALATGAVAALGTVAFTGRRELSPVGDYFLRRAESDTGGTNVVNTVLVDYRGADTLGEAIVVGTAALGLLALLRRPGGTARPARPGSDAIVLRVGGRVLVPGALVLAAFLFLRGHDEPGGGFISALVAGVAVGYSYLAHGPDSRLLRVLRPELLVGVGMVLALTVGIAAQLVGGTFLAPLGTGVTLPLIGTSLSSALLFESAVFLMVVGLLVAAVQQFGPGADDPVTTDDTTTRAAAERDGAERDGADRTGVGPDRGAPDRAPVHPPAPDVPATATSEGGAR